MYHATRSPLRTIVVISNGPVRAALLAELSYDPRFKIIEHFASLGDAYAHTEAQPPDVTICSKDIALLPEFPMFEAMLNIVGSTLLTVHASAGAAAVVRALGMPSITAAATQPTQIVPVGTPQRLVAIGASTGGIEALSQLLSGYPMNCPPTVIVQHIKAEFLTGVVDRLDRVCPATVVVGTSQLKLRAGQVVFAPGLPSHLEVQAQTLRCTFSNGPHVSGHRPSVDVLFQSAAALKGQAVGVILTGMGRDGATGLGAMRRAGAWTIAQDAVTSTVHGMPRIAAAEGAACEVLPLHKISKAILAAALKPQDAIP